MVIFGVFGVFCKKEQIIIKRIPLHDGCERFISESTTKYDYNVYELKKKQTAN